MINFDKPKLYEIIKNIYELSHIKVSIFNEKREEILYYPYKYNDFCSLIRKKKEGNDLCVRADQKRFDEIDLIGEPKMFKCPMGLTEVFSPIKIQGIIVGYITLGQILTEDNNIDNIVEKIKKYGYGEKETLSSIQKLQKLPKNIVNASTTILDACAKYLYTDKYINFTDDELIIKITSYIKTHINENNTVENLCKKFYISRVGLYKIFKTKLNITVSEYIKVEKIKQAKELLQNKNILVKEVASAVGEDYNYFSKLFYKYEKIQPKKYQLKYSNK